jgi:uncharacterized membrane-anchored protein
MKLATLRRGRTDGLPGVSGVARLDRRTNRLSGRLNPGDIAIIDHVDLDRVAAESLLAAKVVAVVNAQPSISGRYPNLGPALLADNGIILLDNVGADVFAVIKEGTRVRIDGDTLYIGEQPMAAGNPLDRDSVAALMAEARLGLTTQMEAFAANTGEYMKAERELLLDGVGVPDVRTKFAGRHAVVVVRGYEHESELASLKNYIREFHPVLVGVDGGADALREAGYKPELIIGDLDAMSEEVLRGGAEVVVQVLPGGRAPGLARVQDMGVEPVIFQASGTSEDLAMLLADDKGADLIVAVGSHANLTEFLDRGRAGMASTFLTRLRVGGKLVDAKGVSRLYRSRISAAALLLLVLAAFIAIAAALAVSDSGRSYLHDLGDRFDDVSNWIQGLFS